MPAIGAIIGGGASLLGGIFGSNAANHAADAQANAAMYAAQQQRQLGDESLAFQKQQYQDAVTRSMPWMQAGSGAIQNLWQSLQNGDLSKQWDQTFQAPTAATEQNDPGYQFRLQQGEQALQRAAAAKGGIYSGGTLKALSRYGQDYASNEYGNVYNRALQQYQMGYNQFQNNQANEYNRLAGVAGIGQTSANQLNSAGVQTGANVGRTLGDLGSQLGTDYMNAGAARASGYIGSANAWNGALQGITGSAYLPNPWASGGAAGGGPVITNPSLLDPSNGSYTAVNNALSGIPASQLNPYGVS